VAQTFFVEHVSQAMADTSIQLIMTRILVSSHLLDVCISNTKIGSDCLEFDE
jgi:hypothetical protein